MPAKTPLCGDQIDAPAACVTLSATRPFHLVNTVGVLRVHSEILFLVTLTFDFWPWHSRSSERRTKHVFRVNLAQIRSAVPAIHCLIRVPRIERVSPISPVWRTNGHQTITVNSGGSGPKFTKFLHDVARTSMLLTHPSAFPYRHPLWNASPKKEGVSPILADFAPKIACYSNVTWPVWKPIPDWTSTLTCLPPWNLVKIGLVVSEISLIQMSLKKKKH